MITQHALKELLHYDRATGVFTWRVKRGSRAAGDLAGYTEVSGYVRIRVDGVSQYAHRLAWLYVHGTMPKRVKHRNGDLGYNPMSNLYKAS